MNLRPRNSLQARLSRSIALGVTILWLAATLVAVVSLRHEMDEVFDSALQELAQRVLPLAYQEVLNRDTQGNDNRAAPVGDHDETLTYIVRDDQGIMLIRSHDADPAVFPATLQTGFQTTDHYHFFTVSAISDTLFVTAADPLDHRRNAIAQTTGTLLWPLALLLPLCLLLVWFTVRLTLRPVVEFRDAIGARGQGNLAPVNGDALPEEIAPLAEAVNNLLARLRRALDAERGFASSSAHELRTPIAAALAQTQRLIAELPAGATLTRAQSIETGLKRLARLSSKLLELAKAEGAGLISETAQDLVPAFALVAADFNAGNRLRIRVPPGPVLSVIDTDAFAVLARNLIENALTHGAQDEPVSAVLTADCSLIVTNGGPALDPDTLERLRKPFERASDAPGTGLGLGIAEAIANGCGATLDLVSPVQGQTDGFQVRVQFPIIAGHH
jgi:two-component system OmpR family sensor kinase